MTIETNTEQQEQGVCYAVGQALFGLFRSLAWKIPARQVVIANRAPVEEEERDVDSDVETPEVYAPGISFNDRSGKEQFFYPGQ